MAKGAKLQSEAPQQKGRTEAQDIKAKRDKLQSETPQHREERRHKYLTTKKELQCETLQQKAARPYCREG